MGFPSAPSFSTRVPVQFISLDQPSLSITPGNSNLLLNNPSVMNVNTGTVAKFDQGVDGLNYFRGDGEYAPFAIELTWKQIGLTDYQKLAALRPYYTHYVSYRNVGYFGKLVLGGPKSAGVKTSDVLQLQAYFYPLAPSDQGGAQSVARIATPTTLMVSSTNTLNSGYIPASLTTYYWLTFSSKYGETLPQAASGQTNSNNNTFNTISWTWPSSTVYCEKASIYVSNTNDPTTSLLIGEVPNGLSASWSDYVGYQSALVDRQPPIASTAYRGQWCGGIWLNES